MQNAITDYTVAFAEPQAAELLESTYIPYHSKSTGSQ